MTHRRIPTHCSSACMRSMQCPQHTLHLCAVHLIHSATCRLSAQPLAAKCMLAALGLPLHLDSKHPSYTISKVSVFASETRYVMPATNKELRKYPMFEGCVWVTCFPHVGNLFLIDQLKIPSIANLVSRAKWIALNFRTGTLRKLFLTCVNTVHHAVCHGNCVILTVHHSDIHSTDADIHQTQSVKFGCGARQDSVPSICWFFRFNGTGQLYRL